MLRCTCQSSYERNCISTGAAFAAATRRPSAWEIGLGAHVAAVAGMLVIEEMLTPADVTPIYRIGMAVAAVVGILLVTSPGKAALGKDGREDSADRA